MTAFLDRHMQGKQSMYKCVDCEKTSMKMSRAIPFLHNRIGKGSICPECGSVNIQKISISMVMSYRWTEVRERLEHLRTPISVKNNG
jgi:DNA-directed RNA polymerase subunit RPC12/RpoP